MHTSHTIIKLINFDHNNLPATLKYNIEPESKTVNSASWMYYKVKGNFYPEILTFKLKVTKNLQDMLVQTFTDIIIKDFYTVHNMANFNINWSNNWIQDAIAMQLQNKNNTNWWNLVYLWRSSSAALRKSTVCVTGLAIRMRTSKVS